MKRPFSVTILIVLVIIAAIVSTYFGLSLLTSEAFLAVATSIVLENKVQTQYPGSLGIWIGAILFAVGIGYFIVSYGLVKEGRRWAWTAAVLLSVTAIIIQITSIAFIGMRNESLISSHVIGIMINGTILFNLNLPSVKLYCSKSRPIPSGSRW